MSDMRPRGLHPGSPESWPIVDLANIDASVITPPRLITGVLTLRTFNDVEREICGAVSPAGTHGSDHALRLENKIAGDRISNHIIPDGFNGSLLAGEVAILPLTTQGTAEVPVGVSALYMGTLRSSRGGRLGQFCLETTYRRSRKVARTAGGRDYLRRTIGHSQMLAELKDTITEEEAASIEEAVKLARFALAHLYGAGSPGLGKHN